MPKKVLGHHYGAFCDKKALDFIIFFHYWS